MNSDGLRQISYDTWSNTSMFCLQVEANASDIDTA